MVATDMFSLFNYCCCCCLVDSMRLMGWCGAGQLAGRLVVGWLFGGLVGVAGLFDFAFAF